MKDDLEPACGLCGILVGTGHYENRLTPAGLCGTCANRPQGAAAGVAAWTAATAATLAAVASSLAAGCNTTSTPLQGQPPRSRQDAPTRTPRPGRGHRERQ